MGHFSDETRLEPRADGAVDRSAPNGGASWLDTHAAGPSATWRTRIEGAWRIGDTPNGGYALTPVLRAMLELADRADPLSVTTHFLRPTTPDHDAEIHTTIVRAGRRVTTAIGALVQDGATRLTVSAVLGELGDVRNGEHDDGPGCEATDRPTHRFTESPPDLPPPERCVDRRDLEQGIDLAILDRLDVRIHPDHAVAGASDEPVIAGWIRFTDGTPPTSEALPLFADAFPPSIYPVFGEIGWVPTIELTVHPRRRPSSGWLLGRFRCDDLSGEHLIESGVLWDETGAVVAHVRQLGLYRPAAGSVGASADPGTVTSGRTR